MSKKNIALLTVILAIFIDQIVKIYIKTNFFLGEEVIVFDKLTPSNSFSKSDRIMQPADQFCKTSFKFISKFSVELTCSINNIPWTMVASLAK